jgi:hypothetical protein
MKTRTMMRTAAVGATCALAGAAAGIAGGTASTNHRGRAARAAALKAEMAPGLGFAVGIAGDAAGPPVHSESVVPNDKGGFDTVTMDRGAFASLSGDELTITEGTKSATYKTVSLKIPSDASVYRNGEKAALSDIKSGDTVTVVHGPSTTVVNAFDAEHEPRLRFHKIGDGPPPAGPLTEKSGEGPAGEGPPPPGAPDGASAGSGSSESDESP